MKGMKQTEGLKHREWFDEYKARNRTTNEIVLMARVKNGLDVKGIESTLYTRIPYFTIYHITLSCFYIFRKY